jgi:hypothetical protein
MLTRSRSLKRGEVNSPEPKLLASIQTKAGAEPCGTTLTQFDRNPPTVKKKLMGVVMWRAPRGTSPGPASLVPRSRHAADAPRVLGSDLGHFGDPRVGK